MQLRVINGGQSGSPGTRKRLKVFPLPSTFVQLESFNFGKRSLEELTSKLQDLWSHGSDDDRTKLYGAVLMTWDGMKRKEAARHGR